MKSLRRTNCLDSSLLLSLGHSMVFYRIVFLLRYYREHSYSLLSKIHLMTDECNTPDHFEYICFIQSNIVYLRSDREREEIPISLLSTTVLDLQ